ncbi:MAG: hypothetical protein K2K72_05935 [Duncaniella sp.]|nr:hypothetical protein [Duncaniella sp.]
MMNFIESRNRHFIEAARRVIRELPAGESISIVEVARKAAMSRAPHYYCTYEYALRVLRVMAHGRLGMRRDRRRAMFEELRAKCDRYMEAHPGCRLPEALGYVLSSESASQFFISESTALRLVQQLRGVASAAPERRAC